METRLPVLTAAVMCSGALLAQPTLDHTNNVPNAGMDYLVNTSTGFVYEGGTGADQTYGFWMLESTGNRDIMYRDAAVTPTSAQVPGASLISTDGGTDTLFWRATPAGLELLADKSQLALVVYSDPIIEREYPCTFGTQWSDALAASYSAQGFPVNRVGTVTGHADGYGTLELPAGAVPDVLRIKVRKEITDQSAIVTVDRISTTYYFFTELVRHPLLRLQVDSVIVNNGTPSVTQDAQWMLGEGNIGMDELAYDEVRFTVYPNPATDLVDLSIDAAADARSVEVMDATGRLVALHGLSQREGTLPGAFSVAGLAPGVYHVRLVNTEAVLGTRRLVVR